MLPLFFSKKELVSYARDVFPDDLESKIMVGDLNVLLTNMLRGPAGLLRMARFFCSVESIEWMKKDMEQTSADLFGSGEETVGRPLEFKEEGGFKLPWISEEDDLDKEDLGRVSG